MTALNPLVIEQVTAALGLPVADPARTRQREALGLQKSDRPAWCTDGRVPFFSANSVEATAVELRAARERLRAVRAGVLPPSWSDFEPVVAERGGPSPK